MQVQKDVKTSTSRQSQKINDKTESEKVQVIVSKLIDSGIIKFYRRYV